MNKQGQTTIFIILAMMLAVILSFFFLTGHTIKPIIGASITTTGGTSPEKGTYFEEKIDTPNLETIDKSSEANNFIKYSVGVAGIIFAVSSLLGVIYLFYRNHNKQKKKI